MITVLEWQGLLTEELEITHPLVYKWVSVGDRYIEDEINLSCFDLITIMMDKYDTVVGFLIKHESEILLLHCININPDAEIYKVTIESTSEEFAETVLTIISIIGD